MNYSYLKDLKDYAVWTGRMSIINQSCDKCSKKWLSKEALISAVDYSPERFKAWS